MGRRKPDSFERVEPDMMLQALDAELAKEALMKRRLEPGWLSNGEFFQELMLEEIRRDLARALYEVIRRRHPTLEDFVTETEPLPLRHPLLVDNSIIIDSHNARTLCYIAGQTAMRCDPHVQHILEPEALRTVVGSQQDFPTVQDRVAFYAEERLFQRYAHKLIRVLGVHV